MNGLELVLRGGQSLSLRSYSIEGGSVRCERLDGSAESFAVEEIDLAATLAANAGRRFAPSASGALLELLGWRSEAAAPFFAVEGVVRNASPEPLRRVVARVLGYGTDGSFLGGEESLVDRAPLEPGGDGRFRVVWRPPAPVERTELSFLTLTGETLPHRPALSQ